MAQNNIVTADTTGRATAPHAGRLDEIQVLRGIAALCVVVLHGTYLFFPGGFGVEIFFTVSGFIMMYVTRDGAAYFVRKRIARIVPLYWLVTLLFLAETLVVNRLSLRFTGHVADIEFPAPTASWVLRSLVFLPPRGISPFHTVAWTLIPEVWFYAVFAVVCKISIKYRGLLAVFALWLLQRTFAAVDDYLPVQLFYDMYIDFTYGIIAFHILRYIYARNVRFRRVRLWLVLLVVATLSLIICAERSVLMELPRCLRLGLPAATFAVLFCILTHNRQLPRWAVRLGDMSYSLYLIHTCVVKAVIVGIRWLAPSLVPAGVVLYPSDLTPHIALGIAVLLCATLLVSLPLSWLCYRYIEQKLTRRLQSRLTALH